jgi:hypothetical protein
LKIRNDSYDGEEDDADFGPDPFGKDQGDSELDEFGLGPDDDESDAPE